MTWRVALGVALLGLLFAGAAGAAVGGLTQKPGTGACISETGSAGACVDGKGMTDPHAVVISPDGNNAYSASFSDGSIAVFDRNPLTGALTQKPGTAGCISETGSSGNCVDGRALSGANSLAISPDGRNVYATSFFGSAVTIFDRNTSTGELTQKAGTAGCISDTGSSGACVDGSQLDTAEGVEVTPDGNNVYVAVQFSGQGAVAIFDRDAATGALTQKAGTAGCISENGSSGACVNGRGLSAARGITLSGDGANVYVASAVSSGVAIFDRNTTTGALTQKAGTAGCVTETGTAGACADGTALSNAISVDVSPDGSSAYVATQTGDSVVILDRNTSTGALTQKAGTAGCISDTGTAGACVDGTALNQGEDVTVAPDGATVYMTTVISAGVAIFDRNTSTGALTQKAGTAGCVTDSGTAGACVDGVALGTPHEVTVSPDEANVYVAAQASAAVAIFDRSTPPQTTIDSGPAGATNDSTPTFGFSSSEAGSTFECRVDGEAFTICTGPGRTHTPGGLTQGPHTFQVRAQDTTADFDLTPASRSFSVDTAAPDTVIDSGPSGPSSDDTPTFGFSASEAGTTFECRFDSAPFKSCAGPGSTHSAVLKDGSHTFEARALDAGANVDPTPALRSFSVDSTPPITTLGKVPKPIVKTKGATKKVKISFSSESGASFECKLDNGTFSPCSSPFAAKAKSKPGKGAAHTVTIRAIDALGNVETDVAAVAFRLVRAG